MKIIVLQGMPKTGKTTTLNLVYELLVPGGGGISTNRQPLGGDPHDFSDIILWNGNRIAIFTMGDFSTYLANAIYEYDRQNCSLVICALSTNTPKIRANNAINQFDSVRINKTIADDHISEHQANTTDAQTIFNLI